MKIFESPRYAPPGHDNLRLQGVFIWTMIILVVWGLSFLSALWDTVYELKERTEMAQWAVTDFGELMSGRLTALPIGVLLMGILAGVNYSRFWQGSKSIYLMRRLPNKWDLHRRCLTVPAVCCGVYLLTAVLIFAVCVVSYRMMMPENYLPEDWVQSVIRSVTTLQIFGV